ncbi:hypothetical protein LTR17_017134 [Elasticomyces elasticus]|nr:hypothetical protein LTR17_017134 [Elasticomyces elasticus]
MPSRHIAIPSEADVIITYRNPKGSITHTFYVSSSILRHGSPYFDNVLGRNIQDRRVKPTGLQLQGDDPKAMVMMFRVLHSHFASVPGTLTPARLRAMAVVADKYDCTGVLNFFSGLCIKNLSKTAALHQLPDILYAAYHFHQAELFGDVGKELILRSEGPIIDVSGSDLSACIEDLNQTRQDMMHGIHKFIEDDIELRSVLCAHEEHEVFNEDDDGKEFQSPQCKRSAVLVTVLLRRLSDAGVWPASAWLYKPKSVSSIFKRRAKPASVSSVLDSMRSLYFRPIDFENFRKPTNRKDKDAVDTCGFDSEHCPDDNPGNAIRKYYAKEATRVAESVPRACYHCYRKGSDHECIAEGAGEAAAESDDGDAAGGSDDGDAETWSDEEDAETWSDEEDAETESDDGDAETESDEEDD